MTPNRPKEVIKPYYEGYDQRAELRRGTILFIVFLVLTVVAMLGWTLYHLPNLFAAAPDTKHIEYKEYARSPQLWYWNWAERKGVQQYLDWLLASLAGGSLFALSSVARFLSRVEAKKARFRAFTGWYITIVVRGCIIAMVVLWLLTRMNLEVGSGLVIETSKMPSIVLAAIAFILGFYGHVARSQLDEIVRSLFPRAWALANEGFGIRPKEIKVIFGKQVQFRIDPVADVTWSAESLGTVDGSGLYTAPPRSESATPGTRGLVRAALRSDPSISQVATVTLVPFIVVSEKFEMAYDETQQLSVDGLPEGGVAWECNLGTIDQAGKYTAPKKAEAEEKGIKEVTITARSAKEGAKPEDLDSVVIRLKQ